ncbi:hypothetical protein SAMN05216359_12128 [Roseateles sp. YR242]|uniref:hypothetical protein n=1 Tax=Roseateles sp. YR242 TaxID=1855305 RepID=UPI0008CC5AC1|nr:hypothetical protein [Roseateles sp. YR242]SEL87724.1 hypothetical protein SAMN05216359_12128 [Roseateles sp. YR242]
MNFALLHTLPTFAPVFFRALGTNLSVAAHALAVGLPIGLLLGLLCLPSASAHTATGSAASSAASSATGSASWPLRLGASAAGLTIALLRAAPAFVVMYVLLHATPARWGISPEGAVALALAAYAAAYVADTFQPAAQDWRAGASAGVQLFLTGLVRCFFVMVLSSGFGAAVGVTEATAVTLKALEQLPGAVDRLGLMGCVVLVFIAMRHGVNGLIRLTQRPLDWLLGQRRAA